MFKNKENKGNLNWAPVPWLQHIPDRTRHTRSAQNLPPKDVIQSI